LELNIPNLKAQLYEHQKYAIQWMLFREREPYLGVYGGMLCDMMGLGKTLSILSLIALDESMDKQKTRTLIVCAVSIIGVWENEIKKYFGTYTFSYCYYYVMIININIFFLQNSLKHVFIILRCNDYNNLN